MTVIPAKSLRRFPGVRDHLVLFFAITLGWTWIVGMIPVALGIAHTETGNLIFMLTAGPAPSVVGLVMVLTTYSTEARKDYFRRFVPTWRGSWFVLLYAALLLAVSTLGVVAITGERPDFVTVNAFATNPLTIFSFIFFMYLWGPVNEEFGWRGFALDALILRHGFVRGNLILGVIWGIWHVPWIFYIAQWQSQSFRLSPMWFLVFIVATIATSFVMAIAYVLSKRNYFAATTVHALSNAILGLAYASPSLQAQNVALACDIALSVAIILVAMLFFRQRFRARLDEEMRNVIPTPACYSREAPNRRRPLRAER